jgi:uncharacterized membrane protein YfcA
MYCLVFIIAFLYSSVGHGGASGYIAVMALCGLHYLDIRINALLLNIAVAGISFWQFSRFTAIDWKLARPLLISSVPMAFLGGNVSLSSPIFKYLLALILLLPVIRFAGLWQTKSEKQYTPQTWTLYVCGAVIGLLAGMLGIGGGILLTPLLLWNGWTDTKQAAIISALFIMVNSASGFLGLMPDKLPDTFFPLLLTAVTGGLLGSYLGSLRFSAELMKRTLAIVLLIAIYKLVCV